MGRKRTGIFLLIAGSVLSAGSTLLFDVPRLKPAGVAGDIITLIFSMLSAPMLVVGAFLYWRSRQYADKAVAERVISDSKPDVLYLRGFGTDPSIGSYVISAISMGLTSGWKTDEEQLGEVLLPFGDFVAIGKPGEILPTPGAARLYVSDAEWKKVVRDRMQNARLVVIRAGTSEGLLWELKEAVQVVNPKNLLILIKLGEKQYEAFRKQADQIFNVTFPIAQELKRFGTISGFLRFSPSWSPNFLPLRAPLFRCGYKRYCGLLKFTLRPVFEEHGLAWQPPLVSIMPIVMSATIGVMVLLQIVMSYLKVFSWSSR